MSGTESPFPHVALWLLQE